MQITVNETGARTVREARPMQIEGKNVYVTVEGTTASLHVAGRIVGVKTVSGMTIKAAQDWAGSYREGLVTEAETVTEADAEAGLAEAGLAEAVALVHAKAAELHAKADNAAKVTGPVRSRNSRGRMITIPLSDPRHPSQAAVSFREDAIRLAAWNNADEAAYKLYLSDGIGDTDGWYAPEGRAAWAATFRKLSV